MKWKNHEKSEKKLMKKQDGDSFFVSLPSVIQI